MTASVDSETNNIVSGDSDESPGDSCWSLRENGVENFLENDLLSEGANQKEGPTDVIYWISSEISMATADGPPPSPVPRLGRQPGL